MAWATVRAQPKGTGSRRRWVALEKMASRHTSDDDPELELLKRDRQIELAQRVARFWWIGVLRGAIALALGVSALLAFVGRAGPSPAPTEGQR